MPLLSVVLPTFNSGEFVVETLQSLLAQTFSDFELLIMDDASSDGTWERLANFDDPRISRHRNGCNVGLPTNMNIAMAMAKGKYLARVDHDDCALPERFALQVGFLEKNPDITVVGSQLEHFHDEAGVTGLPLDDATIKARMVEGANYLANQSTLGRLDFYRAHALQFDPNLYVVDDLGFWMDCMLHGARFANLPEPLTRYRIHPNMTSRTLRLDRLYASKDRIYRRFLPLLFPQLRGHDCEQLLALYRRAEDMPQTLAHLVNLHRAARVALSEIDTRWGQSADGCRTSIINLLNRARQGFEARGILGSEHATVLDLIFQSH
ncbi:glycosyltransferase involved in cell wall biosynthesis [Variovorax boronicumulans]|uniref:Glycosyltransferase involved in cell wall biosynthesis n=1 Tax=Variovorax boronicumulans TaxID=436515 RepID=A0AAW8CWQ3_9BURK|nr:MULTISPECIES: glycosyltransferase [Variovorax]MDP9892973.1 glycosyltransferase involved in cell wall biosynthesis [Variovorax boronicumulans]MDQ0037902.1 glycosyltransferase involved in cell wall biosynthesis [Variovorax boronicumulans]MDQ0052680.1 glycosyltransferase involved in cell wall biosynthesis [Variovorax boronicumulans]MDQ0609977.1 glycosyltransferase involved in cell wall biosynthesis [Variovorax sp. W1I1]